MEPRRDIRRFVVMMAIPVGVVACGGTTETADTTVEVDSSTTTVEDPTTTAEEVPPTTAAEITTTTTEPSPEGSSLDSPIGLGAVVQVGDWRLRVVSVTPDATDQVMAENQFNDPPPEGNQFFIAAVEATYSGSESSTFWVDMSLKAVGDSNVAYEGFDASCGVIPNAVDDSGETFPGGTISGNVCWNIQAADAGSLVMIAEESFSFEETRTFFALVE